MHVLDQKGVVSLVLVAAFYGSTIPAFASTDANDKSESPAKREAAKIDAPAPLNERERWLLDRVEELEKRVADIESKGNATASSATEPSVAQPSSAKTTPSAVAAAAPSLTAGARPANSDSLSNDRVAAVGPQATEKGTTGATRAEQADPFAFADFTWLDGNSRTKDTPYATSFFTPEIRANVDYNYSFSHSKDDTIGGSSEVFRHGEVQVTQLGVGGDMHYDNVRARLMTQFGLYSQTTPRNDASPARGQWNLDNAYRYISEGYGGDHLNHPHGDKTAAGGFNYYYLAFHHC